MGFASLPSILAGDILDADDLDTILDAITELRPLVARKTSNQTNTTTTIADDTELQLTLEASTTYMGNLFLIHNAPAAGDLKLQFSVPSGAAGYWNPAVQNLAAGAGTVYQGALPIATQAQVEGQAADTFLHAKFVIVTSSAGTFKAQHALNTASGTLTVYTHSLLVAQKVQ